MYWLFSGFDNSVHDIPAPIMVDHPEEVLGIQDMIIGSEWIDHTVNIY